MGSRLLLMSSTTSRNRERGHVWMALGPGNMAESHTRSWTLGVQRQEGKCTLPEAPELQGTHPWITGLRATWARMALYIQDHTVIASWGSTLESFTFLGSHAESPTWSSTQRGYTAGEADPLGVAAGEPLAWEVCLFRGCHIWAVCTGNCIRGSSKQFQGIPHSGPSWAAWGGGSHSLVMPSARMSDILQQDDKMRMLGWSMMSTCPGG